MRRLLLARHAKSSWGDVNLRDHDRPLNARGRRSAPLVAGALNDLGVTPDAVISSTSARTRETWARMEPVFEGLATVEFLPELYLASPHMVLAAIASVSPSAATLMVLGHNPSTHALAAFLSREGDPERIQQLTRAFPTGAVAVIELAGERWEEAEDGGELLHFILPRHLE